MGEFAVRVTPRSSRNAVQVIEGEVRVWTTAAPTDGQANDAVCKLVAKRLRVAPSRVTLVRGAASRDKTLAVEGLSQDEILAALLR